jgi:hypothetical protein
VASASAAAQPPVLDLAALVEQARGTATAVAETAAVETAVAETAAVETAAVETAVVGD